MENSIQDVHCLDRVIRRAMYCQKPGCNRSWTHDPCVHAARDLTADAAGKYGICPTGRCGAYLRAAPKPDQPDLFAGRTG